ncbi:MAG TPA: M20/M25/M40 family metallo-hydrolase [Gemmatimonadales bacterium]
MVRRMMPVLLGSLAAGSLSAQGLTPVEQRIVDAIDARTGAAVALLERVVNINSGSLNPDGVRRVGDIFRAEFDALGFATKWIPMAEVERAGHLFAEREGTGPRVLLIGHLDTVFESDSPFQRYVREGTIARGPGTEDMKGGDIVVLLALQALADAGQLDRMNLIVAFTGDEEETGDPLSISRRDLIEAGRRSAYALGFEGGVGGTGTATIARRGFTDWTLQVRATPGHSSLIFRPEFGSGAINEAARIVAAFHEQLRGEEYLTFNPGLILGGTDVQLDDLTRGRAFGKTNVIADAATVKGDMRTISLEQRERTKRRMAAIVAQHLPGTTAEITFQDSYPPMAPTDANYALLARLDRVSRDLGFGPVTEVDPGMRGAADASFVAGVVGAVLDGLGVVGDGGHTEGELVDLDTVGFMAKRAALLLNRLTRDPVP